MSFFLFYLSEILVKTNTEQMWTSSKKITQLWYVVTSILVIFVWLKCVMSIWLKSIVSILIDLLIYVSINQLFECEISLKCKIYGNLWIV
jgi:hypothetical protein